MYYFCLFQHFTQPEVIEQLAYFLIAIGAIMFILSFLGYCGAIRESQCLLGTVSFFKLNIFKCNDDYLNLKLCLS